MAVSERFASNMRAETGLFAAWPPTAPIAIGDFGPEENGLFQLYGQLPEAEVAALNVRDGGHANWDVTYKSKRSVNANAQARVDAGVAEGRLLLEISFSSEDAFMFTAPQVKITQVTNLLALGRLLNARRTANNWDMGHAVVVEVSTAPSATVVLSEQRDAKLKLEVDGSAPVTAQVVANLRAETSYLDSQGVGVRIMGEGPLTPLFRLAYLRSRFIRPPKIVYREGIAPAEPVTQIEIDDEHLLCVY